MLVNMVITSKFPAALKLADIQKKFENFQRPILGP